MPSLSTFDRAVLGWCFVFVRTRFCCALFWLFVAHIVRCLFGFQSKFLKASTTQLLAYATALSPERPAATFQRSLRPQMPLAPSGKKAISVSVRIVLLSTDL